MPTTSNEGQGFKELNVSELDYEDRALIAIKTDNICGEISDKISDLYRQLEERRAFLYAKYDIDPLKFLGSCAFPKS